MFFDGGLSNLRRVLPPQAPPRLYYFAAFHRFVLQSQKPACAGFFLSVSLFLDLFARGGYNTCNWYSNGKFVFENKGAAYDTETVYCYPML